MGSPSRSSGERRVRQNTRFVVPRALPVEVDRRQVQELIAPGSNTKVVLLVAPSGYGKTTVLAQWARRQTIAAVWLQLNEEDKDPKTLFADLAQASALVQVSLENWDRASLLDLSREQLTTALATDLNTHDADLTFVIDGGEYLGNDSARALASLVTELGDGHRVLIAQHDASPFSIAPFLARGEGLVILADKLAFTSEDTRTAAQQFGAPDQTSSIVQEQYQGWPAGVMLALYTDQASTPVRGTALVQHLIGTLPKAISRVLPQLGVLSTWSVEDAQNLGIPLQAGWLDAVLRAGLPLTPLGDGRFAPHDVIRELLTEQLKQDVGLWQILHLKVGQQAEATGQPYSAIRHYVQAAREDLAMRLAEELVPRWYRAADWLLVREALEAIALSCLTAPLRSLLALALLETGEAERGRELAQEQLRLGATPTAHLTLSLSAFRTGDMPGMIEHIEAGLHLATEQRDIIQLLRFKAVYLQSVNQSDAGLVVADEAVQRAFAIGDAALKIATLAAKAYILQQRLDKELALSEYERAYQAGRQLGLTNRLMAIVDQLAYLYLAQGRISEASQLLEEYMAICERNYPLGIPVTQYRLAQVRHLQGRIDDGVRSARDSFEQSLRYGNASLASDALTYFFYTDLLRGRKSEAISAYNRVSLILETEKPKASTINWIQSKKVNAYIAYASGQWNQALEFLDQAMSETLQVYRIRHILTELLRAEIMWRSGRLERSHADTVAQALDEGPEDVAEVRMLHPHFEPLLREFAQRDWHTVAFKNLLDRCRTPPDSDTPRLLLHITTLGRVQTTLNGSEVRLGHVSAVEALVYRVLHPTARQDQLADGVWEGSDLKRARQSAHTARNTLNTSFRDAAKALGIPPLSDLILPGRGRRNPEWMINDAVQLSCDALTILESQTPQEVLRLYGGVFLPESTSEWVLHHREVIHQHMIRVLHRGADFMERQDPHTALVWLVKAADLAQTPEAFERVIMLSHQMGETALAVAAEQAIHSLATGEMTALSRLYLRN